MKPGLLKSASDAQRAAAPDSSDLHGFPPEHAPVPSAPEVNVKRLALGAAICMLLGAAGVWVWPGMSGAGAKAATGSLRVESEPLGADVSIDGTPRGKTPVTLSLAVGQHQLVLRSGERTQQLAVTVAANTATVHHIEWPASVVDENARLTTGSLRVVTEPASAARVSVDGEDKGTTPLTLTDLAPGPHDVVVRDQGGARSRSVTIERGAIVSLVITAGADGVASGWLSAPSAAPLQIYEGGKLVGSTESDRIMLPAGQHTFEFANIALGFRTSRDVRIVPGQTATIALELPRAPMSVNAAPWAQVWIDGEAMGETPLGNVMRTIGTHQLIFRHPELGERRITAVVKLNETTRVGVDMRKP